MIEIFRGDDTDFAGLNEITITIDTDMTLAGYTGCFCFLGVTREFTAAEVASKTVTFAYTSEETSGFVLGQSYGKFTLFDPQGRKAAIQKVLVEVIAHRECAGLPEQAVSIRIENQFDYSRARNKPKINGVVVTGEKRGAEYGLNKIEAYSSASKYAVGDQVLHGTSFYVCTTAIPSGEAWTASHWQEIGGGGSGGGTDANAVHYTSDAGKSPAEKTQARQNIEAASVSDLSQHTANRSNPHQVTKAQVGLGNVDNTSDANKPVSTATQNELNLRVKIADLKAAITNPKDVKLSTADIKAYLTRMYNAVQRLT